MDHYHSSPTATRTARSGPPAGNGRLLAEQNGAALPTVLPLVRTLCDMLRSEEIAYCHWKSNNALDRSANGENDLDLLVDRSDISRFETIVSRLGFKRASAPAARRLPGVVDYFGYDHQTDRLVHVHAHYQLVLGHDNSKNYRLPFERAYIQSARPDGMFLVPAPEFEFIVLIIRLALKHLAWDVILGGDGPLKASERRELDYLQERISWDTVDCILREHLPAISLPLLRECLAALEPGCSLWKRMRMGARVQSSLRAQSRRPVVVDVALKMGRRVQCAVQRRLDRNCLKYRLESGGMMIAIVGGDGSGKSTAVDALQKWLSKHFATTRIHMGKPDWSVLTTSVRAVLKVGNYLRLYPVDANFRATLRQKSLISPGYPWLIRNLCRARDRYRTYLRARRCVAGGSVVLLDRIPLREVELMDGPQADRFIRELAKSTAHGGLFKPRRDSWLARLLVEREERYYRHMPAPEMLFVLRVDPETAIQRRPEDDPAMVRERNQEIWDMNWERADAHIIDGAQPKEDVRAAIKSVVWSQL